MPKFYNLKPKVTCVDGKDYTFYENKDQPDPRHIYGKISFHKDGKTITAAGYILGNLKTGMFIPNPKSKNAALFYSQEALNASETIERQQAKALPPIVRQVLTPEQQEREAAIMADLKERLANRSPVSET